MRLAPVAVIGGLCALACADVKHIAEKTKEAAVEAKRAASTPAMPCDAEVPEPEPIQCISGTLRCGDVIEGTTAGGDSLFDDEFYSAKFCYPAGDGHGGPERVFVFDAPEYTDVTILLQSDCVDLDLAAIAFSYEDACPSAATAVPECEGASRSGGDRVHLQTFNNKRRYLVAVDGKRRETGTFRMSVECREIVRR